MSKFWVICAKVALVI